MVERMRFGVFMAPFHAQLGQNPNLAFFRDLEIAQHLDRWGYDEVWFGEHHSASVETIASPEIFCAWVAAQTSRIKVGTGVISLPYHNPLWVADRALLLDHITRGRFMLGIGPGILATDADMIGLDVSKLRDYLQEDFPVLMHLLRGDGPISKETERYNLVEAQCQLDPYSDFDIALTSIMTPSGPLLAGRYGIGLLQLSGLTPQSMEVLPNHWQVMSQQAAKYGTTIDREKWRIVGIMHIAETKDKAIEDVRFGLMDYFDYLQVTQMVPHYMGAGRTFDERLEWAMSTGNALIGTPDDAIAKIGEIVDASSGNLGAFLFWSQEWASPANTLHNYELFARHVMPVFQGSLGRLTEATKVGKKRLASLNERQFAGAAKFAADHEGDEHKPGAQVLREPDGSIMEPGTSILGTRVLRKEDLAMLTVGGAYIADLDLPGALHVTFVRSSVAHARIVSIDASEARAAPGVVAVLVAGDVDLPDAPPALPLVDASFARPYLASDTVRFVGESLAVILSETAAQGADAADMVAVDYDALPVVVDVDAALASGTILHPGSATNVVLDMASADFRRATPEDGDPFAGCDVVVEARLVNNKIAIAPIEPRACAAAWDGARLTQWACSQNAFGTRSSLVARLGLPESAVRVIVPDVGGSFGGKHGNAPEEILIGWLAIRTGRPLKWVETRRENMFGWIHARGQVQHATLGGTRDGRLLAYRLHVVQDCGAYPSSYAPLMPRMTSLMLTGCYDIPNLSFSAQTVLTNTTPVGPFRGAGRPEASAAIERMVDLFAVRTGLDPAEVRRRNFVAPDLFPFEPGTGASYDSGRYRDAFDAALTAADYDGLRAEQKRRRTAGDPTLVGVGMSAYVEITNPLASSEFGAVEVHPDGTATVRSGTSPHGQGHATSFSMICSELTGIPIDKIEFVYGDTDRVPRGNGTGGSRSLQVGGSAVRAATELLVDKARRYAADLFEADVADIVLDASAGRFHVAGTPASGFDWADLARDAVEPLAAEADFQPGGATFPFGAHVAVVEIDAETGGVRLRRLIAVDDAGTVINPMLFEGQIHGGLASGVAQALMEEIVYDEDGNPLTSNFADYAIISAAELPSFEVHEMVTPTGRNPLGAKGIGESGTVGSTPAVQNAVIDALAHLGVRHLDMPLSPQRVWTALRDASREGAVV